MELVVRRGLVCSGMEPIAKLRRFAHAAAQGTHACMIVCCHLENHSYSWYVPGTYMVACPFMRCHRVSVSSTAAVSACPRCSDPVTLGGGMTMTNFSSVDLVCVILGFFE